MGFEASARLQALNTRLETFMRAYIYPREHDWQAFTLDQDKLWQTPPWFDDLREKARADGPDEVHMSQLAKLTIRDLVHQSGGPG